MAKMKALAGSTDQGGGIGWRAKNSKNYYVVRNKTLGDNYRSTLLRMETDQNSEAQISRILLDGTHSA